jgi:hypothetical protein
LRRDMATQVTCKGIQEMDDIGAMLWGVLFGSIGVGYFIYGKKQGRIVPLLVGIALCAFPYFFSNQVVIVAIGTVLTAVPYFFRY